MKSSEAMAWIVGIAAVSSIVLAVSSSGSGLSVIGVLGLGAASIGFYVFPAITASTRDHPNQTSIMVLNLLLGWTLVGWVVAMVWAVSAIGPAKAARTPIENPPPWDAPSNRPPEVTATVTPPAEKACPFCAEMIKAAAIKCKHCGSEIPA